MHVDFEGSCVFVREQWGGLWETYLESYSGL